MSAEVRLQGAGFDIAVGLGDALAKPTAGGAQWDEIARPEDLSLTDYTGDALIRLDVPVLLDGWRSRADQSGLLNQLLSLSQGGAGGRPPDFIASGPIPYSGLRCVMDAPDFADDTMRDGATGALLRQSLTLKLIEFQDPNQISIVGKAGAGGSGGGSAAASKAGTVQGQPNENLLMVSTRVYGNPTLAKFIGDANGIRDVRKKFGKVITLRLPATASLQAA